ncbi:hypothetical protein G570DRAFT_0007 [Sphingomonas jaspsi DSM 18422]|jgi:hypothetical protein|uniref:Permease n=1 Tax=Sphingomonas jaspsi DSM 18422 TaxID=1123268 RepID=A0A010YS39_9SPHN|nr:hypothetical protein [Sphingomonas jaspsi]EXG83030.1 hypothetical protein G570DRAFT_0007 [Sphingomonas jaspsi DSM 18422]
MDFLKLLKSLEELLYEVIVLIVFYPRTLWLTLRHPQRMMDYADTELGDVQSGQYSDTVSPPLFLMLTLALSYGLGEAMHVTPAGNLPSQLADPERLLAFRAVLFSVVPLFLSLKLLSDLKVALDRETLRAPFYAQCYVTAPFALSFGLALSLVAHDGVRSKLVGLTIFLVGTMWFIWQQAHWFAAKRGTGLFTGWLTAVGTFVAALATIILLTLLVSGATQ